MSETAPGFEPWIRLYGPDGVLIDNASDPLVAEVSITATNSGTFTVLVSDDSFGSGYDDSGSYRIISNGLSDGVKFCRPQILDANLEVNVIGGESEANFVLVTSTNVALPVGFWTPLLTNQFNTFGVSTCATLHNPSEPQRYFLLKVQ